MRNNKRARLVAPLLVLALGATACGGGDDTEGGAAAPSGSEAPVGGEFSMYIGEPENPLLPGNTAETEGGQIVDSLWTGLITYNRDTTEQEFNGVAESIEANDDSTVFTIRLKPDWTFHDGTPVNAQSYIRSWNYTALSDNAQGNSYFFANIAGYDDLQAETNDAGDVVAPAAATEMSGLREIDPQTFEVTLSEPFTQFPITLGYTAFFPLPEAAFADIEAFGAQPIGNGPYMATAPLDPTTGMTVTRYEDYVGPVPGKADRVEFRIYTDVQTAYTDLQAGNLDVVDTVPSDAIASAPAEFGDRFVETESGDITSLGFPNFDPRYADPRVKQALSLAIDREAITEAIFQGTRVPVGSWLSPVVDGYREDACEFIAFDPERANQLLDEAGFDRSQPVELWFNAGADHDQWMEAIGNQFRENIGVDFVLRGDLQFAEYLPLGDEMGFTGPHRAGWVFDYPSPENFLAPLYSTDSLAPAGSNNFFYSSAEFDGLLAEGNAAPDNDAAVEAYNRAEDVLCRDMPSAPLFSRTNQTVSSERVNGAYLNAFARVPVAEISVNQ